MLIKSCGLAVLVACATATAALAAPATVDLRVEGSTQTLFEGAVTTDGHPLTKDASGSHPCDGTNAGTNPSPGPTMTGALDDGAAGAGLGWNGQWNDGFQDFFINSIGPDANATDFSTSWGYFLNYADPQRGGCQQRVQTGDRVLFAYGPYGRPLLELTAPARAAVGESVLVQVRQHVASAAAGPAVGVSVGGQTTAADGRVTLRFDAPGRQRLKATRADAVRSNSAEICVYADAGAGCDMVSAPQRQAANVVLAAAGVAPVARIRSPRAGRRYRRSPRALAGDVEAASRLRQVYLRLRRFGHGGCRWFSGQRERFTRAGHCGAARFFRIGSDRSWSYLLPARLPPGRYILDVKALDHSWRAGRAQARFSVR